MVLIRNIQYKHSMRATSGFSRVRKDYLLFTIHLACQKWYSEGLPHVAQSLARYGHSAVAKGRFVKHIVDTNLNERREV